MDRFNENEIDFKRRFINADEPWIYHYTPEQREQSKQLVEAGGNAPKKATTVPSDPKFVATVFLPLQRNSIGRLASEICNNYF